MADGTFAWFNAKKGYCFISFAEGGQNPAVRFSCIDRGGYGVLEEGQRLIFEVGATAIGPRAAPVRPAKVRTSRSRE